MIQACCGYLALSDSLGTTLAWTPFAIVLYPAKAFRKMIVLLGSSPSLAALMTPFKTPKASNCNLRTQYDP